MAEIIDVEKHPSMPHGFHCLYMGYKKQNYFHRTEAVSNALKLYIQLIKKGVNPYSKNANYSDFSQEQYNIGGRIERFEFISMLDDFQPCHRKLFLELTKELWKYATKHADDELEEDLHLKGAPVWLVDWALYIGFTFSDFEHLLLENVLQLSKFEKPCIVNGTNSQLEMMIGVNINLLHVAYHYQDDGLILFLENNVPSLKNMKSSKNTLPQDVPKCDQPINLRRAFKI